VIDAATKLLNAVNVALRLSDGCNGFEILGVVEKRNGALHRTLVCGTGTYKVSFGNLRTKGQSVRSKDERLVSLMGRDPRIAEIAQAFSVHPITWAALAMVYETAKGIMSPKSQPGAARADHQNLVAIGWLTSDESGRFYDTAGYYKHGYPRSQIRTSNPMSYEDACELIGRLFWRYALEPT
jgi:hypothetical protein